MNCTNEKSKDIFRTSAIKLLFFNVYPNENVRNVLSDVSKIIKCSDVFVAVLKFTSNTQIR